MKRNQWIFGLFLCVFSAFVLQSCDKDDDPEELIAANSDFADFANWTLLATETGPNDKLDTAHGGATDAVRKIYSKGGEARASSGYPVGTVIVKHTDFTDATDDVYHGMVKRGNDFDTAKGDWEYFILNAAGEIQSRGNSTVLTGCANCHANAASIDYIFTTN